MISDVLADGVNVIDTYLSNRYYDKWYGGSVRARIVNVRNEMNAVRQELDSAGHNRPVPDFTSPEAVDWVDVN